MLYPHNLLVRARPKTISGRTSYHQVRLEFLPYPQLIRWFFNTKRFGPPRAFTHASPCPWVDHLVSGLLSATIRPIQTRFRSGSGVYPLNLAADSNSPAHSSTGTQLSLQRVLPPALLSYCLWTYGFRFYFTPLPGFYFTFPSRYYYAIGSQVVFSLGRWSSLIPTGFLVPRSTWDRYPERCISSGYRAFTFYDQPFQTVRLKIHFLTPRRICRSSRYLPSTPNRQRLQTSPSAGFGLFPFRSPLLRESIFLSLPQGTEMFHFPWLPSLSG